MSWLAMLVARSIGIAKPSPMLPDMPPGRVAIEDVMPITSPCASKSGPPELPGLIAASIWIAFVTDVLCEVCDEAATGRSSAEMMPVVTVLARPSGLPTAITGSQIGKHTSELQSRENLVCRLLL